MHIPDLNSQGRALVRRIFLITILVLSSGLNTVTTSYYSFQNRHLTVFVKYFDDVIYWKTQLLIDKTLPKTYCKLIKLIPKSDICCMVACI